MTLTLAQWHERYLQQAQWTHQLRSYVYDKCAIHHVSRVLDVGCGTGVLEKELAIHASGLTYGIDIDLNAIGFAKTYASNSFYTVGNGLSLPFTAGTFDITFCHFFLLWISTPKQAIDEMYRITRPGGYVVALAEPDYGGRIDYPDELASIGRWQAEALMKQGADPLAGRKLRKMFSSAGLRDVEVGILGAQWNSDRLEKDVELEWQVLTSDLEDNLEFMRRKDEVKSLEIASRREQRRILFVPVFYAVGRVIK